jgi:hypothetical protein
MQNTKFEVPYLVILGYDDGEFDCYGCSSEYEVYQVITDRIHDELDCLMDEVTGADGFSSWKDPKGTQDFAEMIMITDVIQDPSVLIDCYDTFFADCWWFKVIKDDGDVWFEYNAYEY